MPPSLPPYALPAPVFPFRHLAALAGRAPIGGAREVALACFMAARLSAPAESGDPDAVESRAARATAAKSWLGTLALPAPVRACLARCADASALGDPAVMGGELEALARATASFLDAPARAELDALSLALRSLPTS